MYSDPIFYRSSESAVSHYSSSSQPPKLTYKLVIDAYSRSLRIVFFFAVAVFVVVNILVFAIRLPHLKKKEGDVEEEEEEEQRRT
jgi:flagellar biosynthesis/type III secretory pathway M-ring protein FliF/YscJ